MFFKQPLHRVRRAFLIFSSRGFLTLALVGGFFASCPEARSEWVVALKPDKNPEVMKEERAKLGEFLEAATGQPARVIVPLSGTVILEGLENGTIDAAFVSATDMVLARERGAGEILLAGEINGKTSYPSYWITLKEQPFASVEDLRGRPVAFASRTSTSGFVIPYQDLVKRGLLEVGENPEKFFGAGQVFFGTGYVSAVERVLFGDAAAAAVSYYVLDEDKHLTPEQRQRLRVLQSQGPVPTHVLVVRSTLEPERKAALRQALLQLNDPAEDSAGLGRQLFSGQLVEVEVGEHLSGITEALTWVKALR
jgi:phosphonate transport system substrate-binding protein